MKKDCRNISMALAHVILFAAYPARADDQTKTDAEERPRQRDRPALHDIAHPRQGRSRRDARRRSRASPSFPSMIQGGFVLGGVHGRGVATCRTANGKWSAPAFFSISGGTWGAQIGVEDVQLVMLAMTDQGMRHMLREQGQDRCRRLGRGPVPWGATPAAGVDWKYRHRHAGRIRARRVCSLESIWAAR